MEATNTFRIPEFSLIKCSTQEGFWLTITLTMVSLVESRSIWLGLQQILPGPNAHYESKILHHFTAPKPNLDARQKAIKSMWKPMTEDYCLYPNQGDHQVTSLLRNSIVIGFGSTSIEPYKRSLVWHSESPGVARYHFHSSLRIKSSRIVGRLGAYIYQWISLTILFEDMGDNRPGLYASWFGPVSRGSAASSSQLDKSADYSRLPYLLTTRVAPHYSRTII